MYFVFYNVIVVLNKLYSPAPTENWVTFFMSCKSKYIRFQIKIDSVNNLISLYGFDSHAEHYVLLYKTYS